MDRGCAQVSGSLLSIESYQGGDGNVNLKDFTTYYLSLKKEGQTEADVSLFGVFDVYLER